MRNQGTPRLYLELHRACLGGVEGIEEVMGIRAGICKAEGKAGEQGAGLVSTEGRDSTGKLAGMGPERR